MSERIWKGIGILLLVTAFLLALLPSLNAGVKGRAYRSSGVRGPVLPEIPTEQNGKIRINEADAQTLQRLPGIGPSYAERIIEERQQNGPFYYPEDLEAVSGIGARTLAQFRQMLDMTLKEREN